MPNASRALACLLTLAACTATLAACGDDAEPERPPATAAERQAYIAKGDAVCASYNALARRLRRQLTDRRPQALSEGSLKPYAAPLQIARDGAKEAVRRFKALEVPAGDEAAIGRLTAKMTQQQELLDKLTNATLADDTNAFKPLNDQLISVGVDESRLARAYGFRQCGSRS